MKMYKYLTSVVVIILLIAACSPATMPTAQPQPSVAPTTAPITEPTAPGPNTGLQTQPEAKAWANAPQAALAARAMLVEQIAIDPDLIQLLSADQIEWPDACLGIQPPGTLCAQVITSGYKIVLDANGREYEFHTNADGSVVLPTDQSSSAVVKPGGMMQTQQQAQIWDNSPDAAQLARADLMLKLKVDPDTIGLVSVEQIDWSDGCLGVVSASQICAAVVTPGYKIVLGGGEKQYEYHTDETGDTLVLVNP